MKTSQNLVKEGRFHEHSTHFRQQEAFFRKRSRSALRDVLPGLPPPLSGLPESGDARPRERNRAERGDPLLQPDAVIEIARAAKNAGLNIWLYTGWTFEQIQKGAAGEKAKEALTQLDVLVDGPFVEKLKTGNAIWRGSDNQRLIDVPRSLAEGSVIELPESKIE